MTINWITPLLGTAPYEGCQVEGQSKIIDVRDLVDKEGNTQDTVRRKIEEGVLRVSQNMPTIICCDYGISRSNAVAAGILAKAYKLSLTDAVGLVFKAIGPVEIKADVLKVVALVIEKTSDLVFPQSPEKILVTGGSGFIGRNLQKQVTDNQKFIYPTKSDINLETSPTKLQLCVMDNNVSTIIHLANPRIYSSYSALGDSLTMLGNVLGVCSALNLRLIYLSNWEVFSGYRESVSADENTPVYARGPYGHSKILAEKLIRGVMGEKSPRYTIIRSGPVYGIGSDKPKFIFNFISKALNNQEIIYHRYKNGIPSLDLLSIDDLVEGVKLICATNLSGVVHFGTGEAITTERIASLIKRELGSSSSLKPIEIDTEGSMVSMNAKKAFHEIGWRPKISIEKGIADIVKEVSNG